MDKIDEQKLISLQRKIEKWGERVGLYDSENGSNYMNQKLKLYDEFGELCEHELKQKLDMRVDDIGDVFVCLVHINKFLNQGSDLIRKGIFISDKSEYTFRELMSRIPMLIEQGMFIHATLTLCEMSYRITGDYTACFEAAYNDIKDRKGKMVKGSFIKEADL